uniref:Translation initiation factor 3 N-terminal domain-containing protein n=1 Tax=Davidia involucrata TaxID=16924 RepID=A0A5B7BD71_DAVIN
MAFWCRIKQSELKSLSDQFKRCYFQVPRPYLVNRTASHPRCRVLDKPNWVIHKSQFEFGNNVRFFAAPVQARPKQEEKDTSGPRLNEKITAEFVRLVTDDGHGVVSRREALERAKRLKLDLVEVQRTAKPPVCKLMDYNKEKYKQQIKEKDRTKSKPEVTLRKGDCKEVRFTGKIEQKDLQMKADTIKRLMERGYRVKCMAMGNEDQDLGGLLSRLTALIEDVSIVESGPRVEKKQAYVLVRHVKFGPSKKGSGKKVSKVIGGTSAEVQKFATLPSTINPSTPNQSPVQFEEDLDTADCGFDMEDDILSEQTDASISPPLETPVRDLEKNKSTWSVFDATDDFSEVFGISDDGNKGAKSSTDEQMKKTTPKIVSSPANTFSDIVHHRPIHDSTIADTVPSSLPEALLKTENRYKSEPGNRFPPTKLMDVRGPGVRDSMRLESQFPNQRQQQFDLSDSTPTREPKRVETDASLFRNLKLPANEIPKQEPSRPSAPSSPAPSYGIFSAPRANDAPRKHGVRTEVNSCKKGNPFDSAKDPVQEGVSANPNLPSSNSDFSQRPGLDKGGEGRWGIFSRDSSNVISSRTSESKVEGQR